MSTAFYRSLPTRSRALIAIAVLLDGQEAENYLLNDETHGNDLSRAANELLNLPIEIRMSFVGALLRDALAELKATGV